MPLTMTTLDIIANFAISFLAGYLPTQEMQVAENQIVTTKR